MRIYASFSLLVCVIAMAGGCGEPAGPAQVSGEVVFDGKPVETGVVAFEPSSGNAPPVTAPIQAGEYEADLEPGQYLVRISAADVAKSSPASEDIHAVIKSVPLLPQQWNTRSKLTVQVKPGENTFGFRGKPGEDPTVETSAATN